LQKNTVATKRLHLKRLFHFRCPGFV